MPWSTPTSGGTPANLTDAAGNEKMIAAGALLIPACYVVIATFRPDGPTICSGLPVGYTHHELTAEFLGYRLLSASGEDHETSWGTTQQFTAVLLQREL